MALTGAAQAAVTIPESCPEGANGNCVRMTKEGELTKLHLSGQGWGPANVDKSVGILNKKEGDDHDLTVIADFETDTNVDVMRGGQAFTKVQGTRTDPTYNAMINGNKLYINLREGVTTTVSYKKESMFYSFGGEVAGGSASGGAISNNLVAVKGTLKDDKTPGNTGVLATGLIVGGTYNIASNTNRVDSVMSGNMVEIENAHIKKAQDARGTGIFGGYIYLTASNRNRTNPTDATGNRIEIRNSIIDTSSVGGHYIGNVPNPGDKGSVISKKNSVLIDHSTLNLVHTHYSTDYGFFGGQDEDDQGICRARTRTPCRTRTSTSTSTRSPSWSTGTDSGRLQRKTKSSSRTSRSISRPPSPTPRA